MIAENMFRRTFYKRWKEEVKDSGFHQLELIVNRKCDLKCSYCYYARYGDKLFPEGTEDDDKILENLDVVKRWMIKNEFKNVPTGVFSGEIFSQEIGFQVLEKLVNEFPQIKSMGTTSNMNFVLDDEKVARLEKILVSYGDKPFHLSASVDGNFMEENRSFKDKTSIRDERFYDKLFKFCKKHNTAFHPMIYSNSVEKWKDNFLWFQENFKKYDINPFALYLLEVRNKEWTEKQCQEFAKFLNFLVKWTYNFFKENNLDFIKNFLLLNPFNIILSPFTEVNRGLACSIQTTLMLRLGDLTTVPCHRTSYKIFETSKLSPDTLEFEDKNISMGIAVYSTNALPEICLHCPISMLCKKGCLGSQYEEMGDLFTPIPTVCRLQHYKVISILKAFKEIGILTDIINYVPKEKKQQIIALEKGDLL